MTQQLSVLAFLLVNSFVLSYAIRGDEKEASVWNFLDFHQLDFFQLHEKLDTPPYVQDMIPLPPSIGYPVNQYAVEDTVYDSTVHLDLSDPSFVSSLNNMYYLSVGEVPRVKNGKSSFGYTAPFQLLSKEGVRIVHSELKKYEHLAHRNERNLELRGLYYLSPFIRSLVTCPVFLGHLERMAGEPLVPHFMLMNSPSANFGKIGDPTSKVVDHWHFDSVAYVAVTLVSDISDMKGGDLQLLTLDKMTGLKSLKRRSESDATSHHKCAIGEEECVDVGNSNDIDSFLKNNTVTVSYERSGACILIQGSEVLHHVTKVTSAKEDRMSLVMSFQPANVFQPDKTIFHTWDKIFDRHLGSAPYEYFRMTAYAAKNILQSYLERLTFEDASRVTMAGMLRGLSQELKRAADLIDETVSDQIYYHKE